MNEDVWAISEGRIAVSARLYAGFSGRGGVYDFRHHDERGWYREQVVINGEVAGVFGEVLALSDAALVVGDETNSTLGYQNGRVLLYRPDTGRQVLNPPNSADGGFFGTSVASLTDWVIVGEPSARRGGFGNGGMAYIYTISP